MRAGSGLCTGQESVLNAVPEGGSAAGLTATIGPWTRGEVGSGRSGTVFEFPICRCSWVNSGASWSTVFGYLGRQRQLACSLSRGGGRRRVVRRFPPSSRLKEVHARQKRGVLRLRPRPLLLSVPLTSFETA